MLQSRKAFAGFLAISLLLVGAIPIAAKDTQWESRISAGIKAENEGNYSQAQDEFAEALKLTAKFQMNDPRLAKTYYESGELRLKQEDWSTAQQYFERALKVQEKLGDPESVDIGNTLYGLATAHEQQGNHQMAVLLLKRVKKIWIKHYGPNDNRLTTILPAMGTYAMLDSDYATAQECYRQLVAVEEKVAGPTSARYGWALNSLASCLAYIGKFSEAEPYAQKAVTVLNSAGDTPTAIDAANTNLQYICQKLGKAAPVVAEKYVPAQVAVTPVQKPTPTPTPPPVTSTLKVTGQLIPKPVEKAPVESKPPVTQTAEQKTTSDIKPWETKGQTPSTTVAIQPAKPSEGKIQYLSGGKLVTPEQFKAMTLANNAYELIREEKYTMAVELLKNALAIYPDLASAHSNLGLAYCQLGRFDEAESQLRQAIQIDAARPAAWLNLASTFQVGGHLKEAVATYSEFVQRFPSQRLVAKVQEIASLLNKELKEQAAVEQSGGQNSGDYFTYASHEGTCHWPFDKSNIKIYIASGTGTPGYKEEYAGFLADSFKQWETACGHVHFQTVKSASGADIECAWSGDPTKVSSPLEGGDTKVDRTGSNISHAAITVLTKGQTADSPISPNQMRVICLHQIGHALGLSGHSPKPQDVMFCSLPAASAKVPLSQRDTATIQKLYTPVVSYLW